MRDVEAVSGPFVLMTPWTFVCDEGLVGTLRFAARTCSRLAYIRKMAWLLRRMLPSMRHLGYVVVAGAKP